MRELEISLVGKRFMEFPPTVSVVSGHINLVLVPVENHFFPMGNINI